MCLGFTLRCAGDSQQMAKSHSSTEYPVMYDKKWDYIMYEVHLKSNQLPSLAILTNFRLVWNEHSIGQDLVFLFVMYNNSKWSAVIRGNIVGTLNIIWGLQLWLPFKIYALQLLTLFALLPTNNSLLFYAISLYFSSLVSVATLVYSFGFQLSATTRDGSCR